MEYIVLTPCQQHGSGNVGDQLLLESALELIEDVHGPAEFNVHWRGEDFTSRLDYVNSMDGILLCGFEFTKVRGGQYRIAEDLDAVEPPLIPIGSIYRFFPADERALHDQTLDSAIRSFLERVASHCPKGELPVRTEWVGQVLRQNGFQTVLTGDPGWYDPDFIGEPFHTPDSIDQLVFTTPHWSMYVEQAKDLLRRLAEQFPNSERTIALHAAPNDVDRELTEFGSQHGWGVRYASHDTKYIDFYRDSDLHVGYRKHGHLAHLRWRRPSVILEEDSRGRGLTETLGTAGIPAFEPKQGLSRKVGEIWDWFPVFGLYKVVEKYGYEDVLPPRQSLVASPNPTAVGEVLGFVETQRINDWKAFTRVQEKIDQTYESGMKPFLESSLAPSD